MNVKVKYFMLHSLSLNEGYIYTVVSMYIHALSALYIHMCKIHKFVPVTKTADQATNKVMFHITSGIYIGAGYSNCWIAHCK